MYNRLHYQFLKIKYLIDARKQDTDEIIMKRDSVFIEIKFDLFNIKIILEQTMIHNHHYSPYKTDLSNAQDTGNVLPNNKKASLLKGLYSIKTGRIKTLKHKIISPKSYQLIIKHN